MSPATPTPTAWTRTSPTRRHTATETTSSQAFNDDKPFDQFIIEQLAGDLLPAGNLDQRRAQTTGLGFLSGGN